MKQIQLVLALILSVVLSQNINAAVIRSSQIVGYGSGNLGVDSTTGTLDGWGNSTAQVTVTNGTGSLIGTNLGLVASAGDKVLISATSALNARNQFATGQFPTATTDTNLYYSFLYRFRNAADVSSNGEIIIRLNTQNSGTANPQHWDLLAKNVEGQMQIGIFKAGANVTNYASTNISVGETFFVVGPQQMVPGVANDVYYLWINPPPDSFGTNEANLPPFSATIGTNATDGAEAAGSGPGRFVVVAGANSEFDEFRIATTWAEATPWFGQCVNAAVAVSPVSVTNSAEIGATFRVFELGTSATFQWQLSTNAGSSWDDISGATASIYNTPNLAMTDNGNRYRAIVYVDCNGSSATSGVASVTLTTPTVTPVGLIMDDNFDDGLRDVPPVTTNNSLWFTANSPSLDAQSGNLVASPVSGASSLWLGYFTETNQLPAHLAIGSSLKVTLPFTPNSFGSHTNNAGLRFGLFDYADGGTRIIIDSAAAGGSTGNGIGVRGYMLNMDFGTTFTDDTPMEIYARNFLPDVNLMGTTGDYESLGSGPTSGDYSNTVAFQAATEYTLEFTVTRTDVNSVDVTTTITGGGTNWSLTVTDTNYAYHRFDAFGLRPNSLETSADSFTFSQFKVEVLQASISVPPFNITAVQALAPNSVILTWDSVNGATYHVLTQDSLTSVLATNATIVATGSSTSYTNSPATDTQRFFRILAPPYTP